MAKNIKKQYIKVLRLCVNCCMRKTHQCGVF